MLGLSGVGAVVNVFTFGGNGLLCERINGVDGFLTFDPSGNTVQSLSSSQSVNYSHLVTGFGSQLSGGSTSDAYDGMGAQWGYRRESGNLFLLGHRYYSSQRGQFLTRDPMGYGGGVNLYGYTGNDPVNEDDPDGLAPRFEGPRNHFPIYRKKKAYQLASRMCKNGRKPVLDYRDSHDNLPHYHPTDGAYKPPKRLEKGMHYSFHPTSAGLPGGKVTAEVAADRAAARRAALATAEEVLEGTGPLGEFAGAGIIVYDYIQHPESYYLPIFETNDSYKNRN